MTKNILALIGCYVVNLLGLRLTKYLMFGEFLFVNKVVSQQAVETIFKP